MIRPAHGHLAALALLFLTALALWLTGRALTCDCGTLRLFVGDNASPEVSQQIADWYTPSHIIHGFLFFAALAVLAPRLALEWRFAVAVLVECAWELVENSPWIINRYRSETNAQDYAGDTVLNSVCDVLAMGLGFWLARRLPVWLSIAVVVGFEALTLWLIRDGLALNVLMLLWPVPAIRDWQAQIWLAQVW